jgi:hypothetical protein
MNSLTGRMVGEYVLQKSPSRASARYSHQASWGHENFQKPWARAQTPNPPQSQSTNFYGGPVLPRLADFGKVVSSRWQRGWLAKSYTVYSVEVHDTCAKGALILVSGLDCNSFQLDAIDQGCVCVCLFVGGLVALALSNYSSRAAPGLTLGFEPTGALDRPCGLLSLSCRSAANSGRFGTWMIRLGQHSARTELWLLFKPWYGATSKLQGFWRTA